jgi:PAS domain S-box-containing protein
MSLIKPFRDYSVRGKLNTMSVITIAGIIFFALGVNLLFKAGKALTLIINIDREHNLTFYNGIHHAHNYLITGNEQDYFEAINLLERANLNAYIVAKIDSFRQTGNTRMANQFLLNSFPESLNNKYRNAKILGRQLDLFLALQLDELTESQRVSLKSFEDGNRLLNVLKQSYGERSPESYRQFDELLHEMNQHFTSFSGVVNKVLDTNEKIFNYALAFLVLFVMVLTSILSFFVSRSLTIPIRVLSKGMSSLSRGNLQADFKIRGADEIGELGNNLRFLRNGLQNVVEYSKKIANRDYSSKLTPRSDEDELSVALNQMAAELDEAKQARERDSWLKEGVLAIGVHLQGELSVRQLSDKILGFFNTYLHIEMGAVYGFDDILGHLELTGTMGLKTDELQEFIKPGEGIIGKVAETREIFILDTTGKHHHIFSATGEYFPSKVYIIPLVYNNKLRGVVELASLQPLDDLEFDFLKTACERAAIHMRTAISRFRLEEVVKTSKQQAQELEVQKGMLQKNLAEIQEIQKKMEWEKLLLDTLLENLPDSIYFKDIESRFLRVSHSMAQKWNFNSPELLIGKSDYDLFGQEDAKLKFNDEQEIIKTGNAVVGHIESDKHIDGAPVFVSTTKMPFRNKQGKLIGTFGISRDITALKTLEIEIKQRNAELEEQKEKMRLANEELQTQQEELRVANEELAIQTKTLIESEKMLQVQQEELTVTNEELEQRSCELEQQRNNIIEKNEELLRIQNQLEIKAKELEANSRYKSEFLANMSHELRTPLNSLLVLSKLIGNNKSGNLTPDQLKSIRIIHKSGSDLLHLINEILDLSKIEAGKITLYYSSFLSADFVEEISQGFRPLANEKKIDFKVTVSKDFPALIFGDRNRLMQIIRNLLSNAFKFTSKGSVEFALKKVSAGKPDSKNRQTAGEYLVFAVKDSGIGITEDKKEAIFEAFQQADGTISRKFGGTGLGLSISRELARMMDGRITVDSIEGLGSEFAFWLPVAEPGKIKNTMHNESIAETNNVTDVPILDTLKKELPLYIDDDRNIIDKNPLVLVIHNDRAAARKLARQCRDKAFNVIAAKTIADGIILAKHFQPGAVLLATALNKGADIDLLKTEPALKDVAVHIISPLDNEDLSPLDDLHSSAPLGINRISKHLAGNNFSGQYRNILVVEDDPGMQEAIYRLFEHGDIIIDEARNGTEAFEKISSNKYDCIILDLGLPDFSGKELLGKLEAGNINIPHVIVHTSRDLSMNEIRELRKYSESIVIKGLKSDERLMDEVELFLHRLSSEMPKTHTPVQNDITTDSVFKGKQILIVDDDIRNIYAIAQIIEERGMVVFEAENGREALEVLNQNPGIDLILMDIMMPEMDGYRAMEIIRETPEISNIPIIVITAKAMKDDYHEALKRGANDYLSKPVDDTKLINLMKIWLSK